MIPDQVQFLIEGGLNFPLPKMIKVRQKFPADEVADVIAATRDEIKKLNLGDLSNKRIAITAGSRKIANIEKILRTIVHCLKEHGAVPFIVPAMGSHGKATAEGQERLLADIGITEERVGAPIISSMDVVKIGELRAGYPIYCDCVVAQADGVVVCGRIKPHTSIKGVVESGLCKMMVVGLGKHTGATCFHRQGYCQLAEILPKSAEVFLRSINILFGLGIVENAFDRTMRIEAITPEHLIERETALLKEAKQNMPRFLLDKIDVLIVQRIGKDISGAGMDPNITGRTVTPLLMKAPTLIKYIVVLDVTELSHGNATGIGGADITTKRVVKKIDFNAMYTNVIASGALLAAKLPVILNNDEEAIRVAIKCASREHIKDVTVVRILDTLHMTEIEVSENYLPTLYDNDRFEILGESALRFNECGDLI
jgi:hypothetical protein